MPKHFSYTIFCLIALSLYTGCNTGNKPDQAAGSSTTSLLAQNKRLGPLFNQDSALRYVKEQVAFGPRIPGTVSHAKCLAYLQRFFKDQGASVFVQHGQVKAYTGKTFDAQNIIASINPSAKTRIMLSAHWDTRPFSDQDPDRKNKTRQMDGANDGASGVAVLMEIARNLRQKNPRLGVDLMLWDVEDYGDAKSGSDRTWCLGTQYWAAHPPVPGYKPLYCINLDMVGGKSAVFYLEKASMNFAPAVMTKVWDTGHDLGFSSYFSYDKLTNDLDDDHIYVNNDAGIPAIDILDYNDKTGFYKYWHKQGDTFINIDPLVLKAVGQTVLETVYREGAAAGGV